MIPNVWLNRQPIPKMRSTLKHLINWTNQDVVAFAKQSMGTTNLDNKQINQLIKMLKIDLVSKASHDHYSDIPPGIGLEIKMKPNRLKLGTGTYKSEGYLKTRYSSIDEALISSLKIVQDNKTCWEDAYRDHLATCKIPTNDKNLLVPLPDNAEDYKKYWGLQQGDLLTDGVKTYQVQQVRPILDGPPAVTIHEKI